MLTEFIKWMAELTEEQRSQHMQTLEDLFDPTPAHADFKRLKGALKRKERRIKQLEAESKQLQKPTFEQLYKSICRSPEYYEIRERIAAAQLYRNLAKQNRDLLRRNRMLQADVETLIYKLHQAEKK